MKHHLSALIGSVLLFLIPGRVNAQNCTILLQGGIYDYTNIQREDEAISSFVNWFRSHKQTTFSQYQKSELNVFVPVGDALVPAGYSQNEQGYQQFVKDVETYNSGKSDVRSKLSIVLKKINPQVISAVKECLTQKGLHVWLLRTADQDIFQIAASFDTPTSKIMSVTLHPIDVTNANCNMFKSDTQIQTGTTLKARCNRLDHAKAVVATVNAYDFTITEGGNLDIPRDQPVVLQPIFHGFDWLSATGVGFDPGQLPTICDTEIGHVVPGGIKVLVKVGGSWSEVTANNQYYLNHVDSAPFSGDWPASIHARDAATNTDLIDIRQTYGADGVVITSDKDFLVCLDPPTLIPGNHRIIGAAGSDLIRISVHKAPD